MGWNERVAAREQPEERDQEWKTHTTPNQGGVEGEDYLPGLVTTAARFRSRHLTSHRMLDAVQNCDTAHSSALRECPFCPFLPTSPNRTATRNCVQPIGDVLQYSSELRPTTFLMLLTRIVRSAKDLFMGQR
jgi:hypothetical protein